VNLSEMQEMVVSDICRMYRRRDGYQWSVARVSSRLPRPDRRRDRVRGVRGRGVVSDIPSLAELREWGYRRGEAYACRLAEARNVLSQARKAHKNAGMSDAKHAQMSADCAHARKVIRSSLRSIERWRSGGFGEWVNK